MEQLQLHGAFLESLCVFADVVEFHGDIGRLVFGVTLTGPLP